MINYTENIKNNISNKRRELGLTQEQLAEQCGISYQAVSKWENGIACPDIMMLPKLAHIFKLSIDELFGHEGNGEKQVELVEEEAVIEVEKKVNIMYDLPWNDDKVLRAVAFVGHKLLEDSSKKNKECLISIEGELLEVQSNYSVNCEDVQGNVNAGDCVNCNDVGGNVNAGDGVNCNDVGKSVNAGDSVNSNDVGGSIQAGDSVHCNDVGGAIHAGDAINCGDVEGNVSAGDTITCGDVSGHVTATEDINCGDVGMNASAGENIECNDVGGDVKAGERVNCNNVEGRVD